MRGIPRLTRSATSPPSGSIILGVGGATEVELGDGSVHPGANVMVEWDAIENWLEFEVGASLLTTNGGVEVPVNLLVKKPLRLARLGWSGRAHASASASAQPRCC